MSIESRLAELGITLATPRPPQANYISAVTTGNYVYLSGTGPYRPDGTIMTGKVGDTATLEDGQAAARLTMLALLANLRAEIGSLDRVKRIVKLLGMVNCTPDFQQQPEVINGASDLLVEIFGERGRHARSAVGMAALHATSPSKSK